MPSKISEYEIENYINEIDNTQFEVFREYEKKNNIFLATNNFFIKNYSDNINNEKYIKICGNTNEKYIEKNNNKYFLFSLQIEFSKLNF